MRTIDVFLQGEGVSAIEVFSAQPQDTISSLLKRLKHAEDAHGDLLVFLEDIAAPLDDEAVVEDLVPMPHDDDSAFLPLRLHLSRCKKVGVIVRFNGEEESRRFPPSATVERVLRWATRRAFELSPIDAAEHVLQLQGTSIRPDRDVHIGTLVERSTCSVAFDLVPCKRVEG